jgi:hypothetical protein
MQSFNEKYSELKKSKEARKRVQFN